MLLRLRRIAGTLNHGSLWARGLADWRAAGVWGRLAGRTTAAIERIKRSRDSDAQGGRDAEMPSGHGADSDSHVLAEGRKATPAVASNSTDGIWDTMEKARSRRGPSVKPPEQIWMQSPFVRGSTRKMTMLSHQLIGLSLDAGLLQMHFSKKKLARTIGLVLSRLRGTIIRQHGNPAYYYIKTATVGRGTYLKRIDIRARGRMGIQWRGHAFIRICCHRPDPKALVRKMLRIRTFPREDRPITRKLDYY